MSAWMKTICIGAFKPWVSDYPLSFWILSKMASYYISHARHPPHPPCSAFYLQNEWGRHTHPEVGKFLRLLYQRSNSSSTFFSLSLSFFYQGRIREEVRGLHVTRKPTTSEAYSTECFLVCWSIRALHWARELNIPSPLTKHNKPSVSLSSVSRARRRYQPP